jgi:lysophospholipase L1-like esterase
MTINTGTSPSTVSGFFIGVYDIASDSWTYQKVMTGDLAKAGGPSGYYLNSTDQFGVTNNILYLAAKCSGNCTDYTNKLFALDIGGLSLDYPRGDVLAANTPAQPAPQNYVALGDSYSVGQGAGDYDPNTTLGSSVNNCYQSKNAYGKVLNLDPYSKFALKGFVACGGAVTSDITSTKTYPGVSNAQMYAVDSTTQVATITIGGNNIGFASVLNDCADPLKNCLISVNAAKAKINSILDTNLQSTYLAILGRSSSVKLYVVDYPPIFAPGSGGCPSSFPIWQADRVNLANELLTMLNQAISTNVNTIRSLSGNANRIQYVTAVSSTSPFNGHDLCASTPFINGLVAGNVPESFHPNKAGQGAYASLIKSSN